MKERINYFDLLKTICIFLVVTVHYTWLDDSAASNLLKLLCILAVPVFFMVNGALLMEKELVLKDHIKRMIGIYAGLVAWRALIFIVYYFINGGTELTPYKILEFLFVNKTIQGIPTEHMWFTFALLKIYIVFPLVKYAIDRDKNIAKYLIVILFCFSYLPEFVNTMNKYILKRNSLDASVLPSSFSMLSGCEYLLCFVLGYVLHKKYYKSGLGKKQLIILLLMMCTAMAGFIYLTHLQYGRLSGPGHDIIHRYKKLSELLLAVSVFVLFSKISFKENKLAAFIGKKTMNIYNIHMMVVSLFYSYLMPIWNVKGILPNLVKTIAAIAVSLLVTELLGKIKPVKKLLNLA